MRVLSKPEETEIQETLLLLKYLEVEWVALQKVSVPLSLTVIIAIKGVVFPDKDIPALDTQNEGTVLHASVLCLIQSQDTHQFAPLIS